MICFRGGGDIFQGGGDILKRGVRILLKGSHKSGGAR